MSSWASMTKEEYDEAMKHRTRPITDGAMLVKRETSTEITAAESITEEIVKLMEAQK